MALTSQKYHKIVRWLLSANMRAPL